MTKYKFSPEQVLYSVLTVFVVAMFCHLALACYYADSEIWLLTVSQKAFDVKASVSVLYKWSFHVLTYLFSHFAPSELAVYDYARTGWMIVAVLAQVLVAYSFSVFVNKRKLFLPLFLAIMTFSAFFNQGFRIRGDILSLFSHIILLLTLFTYKDRPIRWRHYLWILFINFVLVLATPKSLYFYIAQFAFGMAIYKYFKCRRDYFLLIWITHISPIVVLLGVALGTHALFASLDLIKPIHEVIDFYLKSFDTDLFNSEYLSVIDFAHVIKAFAKSFVHTGVFISGIAIYLFYSYKSEKPAIVRVLNIYFGILLLCVGLHNQKFPFFLGTFGTPLIAYTFFLCTDLYERLLKTYARFVTMALTSAMVFFCILEYQVNLSGNNNLGQKAAIARLDDYTNRNPDLVIYDIIGLLPRKTKVFLFVGPGEISRKRIVIDELERLQPDIILFTFKFVYLEPDIRYFLTKTRITVEENVWVKGDYFSVIKTMDYFRQSKSIRGRNYWIIPHPPKKYIYSLVDRRSIKYNVLYFKNGLETKHREAADSFAVPSVYLDIVQTNVEPIGFLQQPFLLFRYDTNF